MSKGPEYTKKWWCSRHGAWMNTKAGALAHEAMSAGKCNISVKMARKR